MLDRIVNLESERAIDISLCYYGPWHKTGYISNYDFGCLIDTLTSYIIVVSSNTCQYCNMTEKFLGTNSPEFDIKYIVSTYEANFLGSSAAMEVEIVKHLGGSGLRYSVIW